MAREISDEDLRAVVRDLHKMRCTCGGGTDGEGDPEHAIDTKELTEDERAIATVVLRAEADTVDRNALRDELNRAHNAAMGLIGLATCVRSINPGMYGRALVAGQLVAKRAGDQLQFEYHDAIEDLVIAFSSLLAGAAPAVTRIVKLRPMIDPGGRD